MSADRLDPPADPGRDHVHGGEAARVTLVEYGDYECPYSRRALEVLGDVQQRLGEDLRLAFRHFPLEDKHPRARLAAEAAEAAAAQGRFWEMHARLFEGAAERGLEREDLVGYASELGLDSERFERELRHHAHADRVAADLESGRRSGVSGTPTFFIGDRRYEGFYDVETLTEALRDAAGS